MLIKPDTRPSNKLLVTLNNFMDYFDLWVGLGLKKKYKMMLTSMAL